jgi:hypothetical protein
MSKPTKTASCLAALALSLLCLMTSIAAHAKAVTLTDAQVENIVKRSYQYVAMYNVIQKMAVGGSAQIAPFGFNKPIALTTLLDHNVKSIARPNNDTFYQHVVLDLRNEPVIIEYPAIDSKFVALETSGYAHYCEMPLLSAKGDFKKPIKVMFYTNRTQGYHGEKIKGVDRMVEADGDFYDAFLRAMPHQADPQRMERVITALKSIKVITLSQFQGKPAKASTEPAFPAFGKTDADVFANNLLEVMQFVFNHTTFDPNNAMDRAVLAAYKPLGVEPGKAFDPAKVAKLDGAQFCRIADNVARQALADMTNQAAQVRMVPQMFMPKGQIDLETQVVQSVAGPIGVPAYVARYIPARTRDGQPLNAMHDYVMKMSKDELPPAKAFWSLTLYDLKNGFFIPNDRKKYSVGENAGYKLDAKGGIAIYISAKKPDGVPPENWLPINREDIDLDPMFRIYGPDAQKMKTWKTPRFEMLPAK